MSAAGYLRWAARAGTMGASLAKLIGTTCPRRAGAGARRRFLGNACVAAPDATNAAMAPNARTSVAFNEVLVRDLVRRAMGSDGTGFNALCGGRALDRVRLAMGASSSSSSGESTLGGGPSTLGAGVNSSRIGGGASTLGAEALSCGRGAFFGF